MMMLSMPRTISRAVRVKNAIQISGLVSHSMKRSLVSVDVYKRQALGFVGQRDPDDSTQVIHRLAL